MATRKAARKPRRKPKPSPPVSTARNTASASGDGATDDNRSPFESLFPAHTPYRGALAALALCLLVALAYFPATLAGFVLDDNAFTDARPVRMWSGLWSIWFEPGALQQSEGHYWPVLYSTFWLEHKLWGFAPAGYHIVNLLLHCAVTLLLWRLLRRLAAPGAWIAAAVFAVHPLHVESVAWVIGRKDLLAAAFYLGAALAYIRFAQDGWWWRYAGALSLFALALLSKTTVVTLPASLLLWHWWQRGRVTVADLARALPFALLGLGITVADWSYYRALETVSFDYSLLERALIAAHALWFYVGKLLLPLELAVIYPKWAVSAADPTGWGYLAAAVAGVAALWFCRRRIGRGALAGVAFFAVTLSPTLGFVDYGYMQFSFVADRYQYLAGAGVIAVLVGAVTVGVSRLPRARRAVSGVVVAAVLAVLAVLSWQQSGIYENKFTYYRHIIALNPQARFAHFGLGNWLSAEGRHEEALAAYQAAYRAARQHPDDTTWNGFTLAAIGRAYEKLERPDEAEAHYRRAVEVSARQSSINSLGALWLKQRRYREALELFQSALAGAPNYAKAHSGIGVALYGLNRYEEALQSFERALVLDPFLEEARTNRELAIKALEGEGG